MLLHYSFYYKKFKDVFLSLDIFVNFQFLYKETRSEKNMVEASLGNYSECNLRICTKGLKMFLSFNTIIWYPRNN